MTPIPSDLEQKLGREWLETNGLGSYASSTVAGAGTRRYHGLLVAALAPPVRRHVLLSRLEDVLVVDGVEHPLSTNVYGGAVAPEGYRSMLGFEARPVPTWHFSCAGIEIERRVWMPEGRQAVAVGYEILRAPAGARIGLAVRPLVAFRGFHALASENDAIDTTAHAEDGVVSIKPYADLPELFLHHNAERFDAEPLWYRDFEYREELARGFPAREDLFSHGRFTYRLGDGVEGTAFFYASLEREDGLTLDALGRLDAMTRQRREKRAQRAEVSRRAAAGRPLDRWTDTVATRLAEAAEQFLVSRADGARTVIAGYHWFEDWGRDTFIALPGLAAATGRASLARELLASFAPFVSEGMVPNRFPDASGVAEYNSVDAALWYVEAARSCWRAGADADFVSSTLMPAVREILNSYASGTRFGIRVDPADGLLAASADGLALTWMDAVVDGVPVTPRRGKAVEINALWYNALVSGAEMAEAAGRPALAGPWRDAAARARESFHRHFVTAEGWLRDVVDGPDGDDASFRPNQIFAVSLAHPVLREELWLTTVREVGRRLLTPAGLRTLDPADPRYRGRYEGSPAERDGAYHNGTAWFWLLGPYATAYIKANGGSADAARGALRMVQPVSRHLGTEGCLGQLSEIADGDAPHTPRGCIAQAWSVAEVARVLLEELAAIPLS